MRKGFILYKDYFDLFKRLSAEECGNLLLAIFAHECGGTQPDLGGAADMLFAVIAAQLDRDEGRYDETCRQRAEAGRRGGIASGKSRAVFREANEANEANTEIEIETEKEKEIETEIKRDVKRAIASAAAQAVRESRRADDPTEARAARERFYFLRKQRAEDLADRTYRKAMQDEAFSEAERERKSTEIALAKAEVKGEDLSVLKKTLKAAQKRRSAAMLRLHITESDLRPHYACKKCSDTGFLPDGHMCDCYRPDG